MYLYSFPFLQSNQIPFLSTLLNFDNMELQLGLSLTSPPTTTKFSKGFDLNNQIMDNSSDHQSIITSDTCLEMGINVNKNKRSFDRAFDHHENHVDCTTSSSSVKPIKRRTTLSLVSWNDQPNEDDDQEEENTHVNHLPSNTQVEEEVNSIVGWPPVKSWRRKFHYHYQNQHPPQFQHHQEIADGTSDNNDHADAANGGDGATNSMYVKVTMDGMGIGRKINLRLHQSYQTLTTTLINMFGKYENNGLNEVERQSYRLTYQDGEGDWLLVGDVPWKTFIQSVKRLKILEESSS